MDEPQGSRLFVVCGKAAEMSDLETVFKQYGPVQYVKMVRDKGVAYVKFERASTAARAMEELNGVVLNDGRGPQLKVLQAESPNANSPRQPTLDDLYQDPVNHPPRSRLFLVVPRTADEQLLQEEMSKYEGLEYCKTDLISSKGIAFAKYSKASQALVALEEINKTNMLAGYRIKCMLAEPKVRRGAQPQPNMGALGLPGESLFLPGMDASGAAIGGLDQLLQSGGLGGLAPPGTPPLSGFPNLGQDDWALAAQLGGLNNIMDISQQPLDPFGNIQNLAGQLTTLNLNNSGGMVQGHMTPPLSPMTPINLQFRPNLVQESPMSPRPTGQRLFVVVHKGVTEEQLARCFRRFPGMEYCDLKRDRITGKSKGYAYVNYSTPEAAQAAIDHLNGIEFPQGSCQQLKVMLADPLVPRNLPSARWPGDMENANLEMGGGNLDGPGVYDPRVVHFYLERPLPDYALKNVFDEHCHVESVQLHGDDPRLGYAVAFTAEDAQRLAVTLNGQNIVGVPISMYLNTFDPNAMIHADHSSAQPMGSGSDVFVQHTDLAQQLLPEQQHIN